MLLRDDRFLEPSLPPDAKERLCATVEKSSLCVTVARFPHRDWTISGCLLDLFRKRVHLSFQILLDEPRMTIQAILFHEIADLTELSFSDHLVVVKIHVIICSSESQRISVAVASRRLIHRIRLFSSALHNLIFTDLYIHEPLHENTLEDSRDRLKSHSQ